MLRVLTLSTLYPDASRPRFGTFVARQTEGLAAHPDVELRVVAPLGIPPFGSRHARYRALAHLLAHEVWQGVEVSRPRFFHVPFLGGRADAVAIARGLRPKLEALRVDFPFDVIDAEFFFPEGPAAVRLGRALGVPVSIKGRGSDIHHWASGSARRQIREAGRSAQGLLAVSEALRTDMIALGMPGERIAVHRTGIDRACFYVRDRVGAKAALGISGPLIVGIGALIRRKGHHIAIEALVALPGVTLAVIGQGAERAALARLAVALGVGDRVRFLGSQPHAVIADWLAAADAMVLISENEGLANAWVEALASGTPIVISDVGGAREVLDRPAAGVVVERNAAGVANGVRVVLDRDADRRAVAATVAAYSWEANTAELYDHLKAVAARR